MIQSILTSVRIHSAEVIFYITGSVM